MTAGSKIRPWAKLLDASHAIVWAIDRAGNLVFLSGGAADWLGVNAEELIGRTCRAGVALSTDPLDAVAASLSPPPDLDQRGTSRLRVRPKNGRDAVDIRYIRVPDVGTLAVGGDFSDREPDADLDDIVRLRSILDGHRRFESKHSHAIAAGVSPDSGLLRRRIALASRSRASAVLIGPLGFGGDLLASEIIQSDAAEHRGGRHEPAAAIIDGSIIEADLLDAALMPTLQWLERSEQNRAGVIVRNLSDMPGDAQERLVGHLAKYADRLQIVGWCARKKTTVQETAGGDELSKLNQWEIAPAMRSVVGEMIIPVTPLASRREDIPLIATAMLDIRSVGRRGDPLTLSRECLDALVSYPWPRESEELNAAIRNAASVATHHRITVEHLPLAIRTYRPANVSAHPPLPSLDDSVRRHESQLIRRAMMQTDGNRTEAAKLLSISRGRLLRKIDEMAEAGWLDRDELP